MMQSVCVTLCALACARGVNGLSTAVGQAKGVTNKVVPGLSNGMDYVQLGSSDLQVSKVCMGTMTFGEQNTLEEGVEQLNLAFDEYGVNMLDTAEMYPVPTKAETQGRTDKAVGMFLKGRNREDVVLATKVSGRSDRIDWMRKDKSSTKVTRSQILESVDSSLQRLGTDYIDLLQIHWPDRYVGAMFGQSDFDPSNVYEATPFEEQLAALQELVDAGKVRHIGVSNETPYGVCSMIALHEAFPEKYPRISSIQNSYSLVVRKDYEAGLSEACHAHNVALLPYSPLASGTLSGKYANPAKIPENARLTKFPGFMDRYLGSQNEAAVNAYCDIAQEAGISPSELALSWCYHRNLVTSTIIGATSIAQLKENIGAYDIRLEEDVMEKISSVYKKYTDPTKAYGA
uniref:NADP-dependent oxidoreductase domain-containing protein n=1 Tax=Attheya septentrionalis TaxID=420275 RepID=A0A6T7HFX3_9STRA